MAAGHDRRVRSRFYNPPMSPDALRAANRARFARLVARPDPDIDVAEGALCIAADGRPDLDPRPSVERLDRLAGLVRARLDRGDAAGVVLRRLHDVLYREGHFRPPTAATFHDPRNSRLDEVLVRRIGLPISLAIVELEVAWRLGLPLHGIGLPGHFIIGAPGGGLIDPAGGGRSLTQSDCQRLVSLALGHGVRFQPAMLRPTGRRQILVRVLRNLRSVHLGRRDWPAALGIVDLLAVVEPADPDHVRDRGLLLGRMGRFTEAITCLGQYVEERPDGHDVVDVRQVIGIFAGRRN